SMFEDAAVRTIASQWNSNNRHRGWSLGVTSAKSAYKPRNLILQFVGDNAKGELGYEVVASNLHLELKQTYYVAASVNIADPTEAGITFYVRNLDQPESEMQIARVKHEIVANIQSNSDLVLGGRDAIT